MSGRTTIQFRRGTSAQWLAANAVLAEGEAGYDEDAGRIKVGDGVTAWADLPYATVETRSTIERAILPVTHDFSLNPVSYGANANFYLSRIGNLVTATGNISGEIAVGSGGYGYAEVPIPEGFRPSMWLDGLGTGGLLPGNTDAFISPVYASPSHLGVEVYKAEGVAFMVSFALTWSTEDAWPEVIPGPNSITADGALVATAETIPSISTQATNEGKTIRLIGPYGADENSMLLGYGDYGTNTGPIDLIVLHSDGTSEVLFNDFHTEMIYTARRLNGGYYWMTAMDPRASDAGQLLTDEGGTWRTITCSIAGLPNLEHIFDVAQQADGSLYIAGSRVPTVAENGGAAVNPATIWTYAIVWKSTDLGVTWTEQVKHKSGPSNDSGNRMYGFGKSGNRLVCAPYGNTQTDKWYTNIDGTWVERTGNADNLLRIYGAPWWHATDEFSLLGGDSFRLEADGSTLTKTEEFGVGESVVGTTYAGEKVAYRDGYLFRGTEDSPILNHTGGPTYWLWINGTADGYLWASISPYMGGGIYRVPPEMLHPEQLEA
jgi:hypothetical protein